MSHTPEMQGQAPTRTAAIVVVLAASIFLAAGCASFATVRSAEVQPGPSLAVQASATTRPGDVAGWFWMHDCEQLCDDHVVGGDLGVTYGWPRAGGVWHSLARRVAPRPAVVGAVGGYDDLDPGIRGGIECAYTLA